MTPYCLKFSSSPQLDKKILEKITTTIRSKHIKNIHKNLSSVGSNKDVPVEEFVHEWDIVNYNRIFLKKTHRVVKDCKDLGISF